MNNVEIIFKDYLLKFGFWPFIFTISTVLIIIIITIILVHKEVKKGSKK